MLSDGTNLDFDPYGYAVERDCHEVGPIYSSAAFLIQRTKVLPTSKTVLYRSACSLRSGCGLFLEQQLQWQPQSVRSGSTVSVSLRQVKLDRLNHNKKGTIGRLLFLSHPPLPYYYF